ncbi:DUF4097 domain-containing protein [Zongyangia hominis]|uniref:DUF4097 family beta strand repeat protein n=1 Tax=Zongyangia hominis TaxID=2763677 RepID=A0A926EE28_9FIRM|nr:DUF4097 domain-containing protein [Zongyangia hominis]MBC8570042.1 DUF4097 family beta strand repeat protein [Zongyangia hominis]
MKKTSKWMLIVGGALVFMGLIVAGFSIMVGARTSITLGKGGLRVSEMQVKDTGKGEVFKDSQTLDAFHNIDVKVGISNITLIPSDHFGYEYQINRADSKLTVSTELGVLTIRTENRAGFNMNLFGMVNRQENYLKIYYPKDTKFRTVKISNDLGELHVNDLEADEVEFDLDLGAGSYQNIQANIIKIEHSSGEIKAENLTADVVDIDSDLGSTSLKGVKAGQLTFEGDLGRLDLQDSVITSSDISSSLGEVSIANLESDGIKIEADSGAVHLSGTLRGHTEIHADLGNVDVATTLKKNDYNYNIHSDLGSIYFNKKQQDGLTFDTGAANDLIIRVDSGSIHVNVAE